MQPIVCVCVCALLIQAFGYLMWIWWVPLIKVVYMDPTLSSCLDSHKLHLKG